MTQISVESVQASMTKSGNKEITTNVPTRLKTNWYHTILVIFGIKNIINIKIFGPHSVTNTRCTHTLTHRFTFVNCGGIP